MLIVDIYLSIYQKIYIVEILPSIKGDGEA